MNKKVYLGIGAVVLAILLVGQFALPTITEFALEKGLAEKAGIKGVYDVQVEASPNLKLLTGKFDMISFNGANLSIGDLNVAKYTLTAYNGGVSVTKLLSNNQVVVAQEQVADLSLYVTEADFEEFLDGYFTSLKELDVTLADNAIHVEGNAEVLGFSIPIAMDCQLWVSPQQNQKIALIVEKMTVVEEVPEEVLEALQNMFNIWIPFEGTNPPVYFSSVDIQSTGIIIESTTTLGDSLTK